MNNELHYINWFLKTDKRCGTHARALRYSRRGGAHHSSPVLLPCRPSHPDFNVTIRRVPQGIASAGFDFHPSEGFVVPGSDIEDRDGTGFHAVLELQSFLLFVSNKRGNSLGDRPHKVMKLK